MWDNIISKIIENCWVKTDILPKEDENENEIDMDDNNDHTDIQIHITYIKELYKIQVLIDQLDFKNSYFANEFV